MATAHLKLNESLLANPRKDSSFNETLQRPQEPRCDDDGWEIVSRDVLLSMVSQLSKQPAATIAAIHNLRVYAEHEKTTLLHGVVPLDNAIEVLTLLLDAGLPISVKDCYGRTPLQEAVYVGRIDVCQFLLELGATLDDNDPFDISPLWIAMKRGSIDLAKWVLTEPRLKTPQWFQKQFVYAVHNMPELMKPMLDCTATSEEDTYWWRRSIRYSSLKQIYGEPTVPISDTPIVLIMQNEHARQLIPHPTITYVLQHKWETFAGSYFRREFAAFIVLLLAFYVPTVVADYRLLNVDSPVDIVLTASRAIAVACSLFLLLTVERTECIGATPRKYLSSFWNWVNLVSYIGILVSVAIDAVECLAPTRNGFIAVLHISLWINLLQFLQVSSESGLLVTMMRHMIKDVYSFTVLYSVFLFGYSGAFYVLLRGSAGYDSFINAFITVFLMLFGTLDYSVFSDKNESLSTWSWFVANVLLLSHLVAVVVMLLNILIAMMTTTFEDVRVAAEAEAVLIRARAIVRIEKSLPANERARHFLSLIPSRERSKYRSKLLEEMSGARRTAVVHPETAETDKEPAPSRYTLFIAKLKTWSLSVMRRVECCKPILNRMGITSVVVEQSSLRQGRAITLRYALAPLEDGARPDETRRRSKENDKDREIQELRDLMAREMQALRMQLQEQSVTISRSVEDSMAKLLAKVGEVGESRPSPDNVAFM